MKEKDNLDENVRPGACREFPRGDGIKGARETCSALREAFDLESVAAPDLWGGGAWWGPTMGIEIEVPWSFYFPDLWERFGLVRGVGALSAQECIELGQACDEREAHWLPLLALSKKCGVPRGNDRYWEFALDPCADWRLVCAQVELLAGAGLLPLDGHKSLQITLGGLRQGEGAQALARLLEALCASPERLLSGPERAQRGVIHSGWARKGSGGVLEKTRQDLKLGASSACEFRVLSVPCDVQGLRELLSTASRGGEVLAMEQAGGSGTAVKAWLGFVEDCRQSFAREGVGALVWGQDEKMPRESWVRYAERFRPIRESLIEAWRASGLAPVVDGMTKPHVNDRRWKP